MAPGKTRKKIAAPPETGQPEAITLAVGHQPETPLSPPQEALFRAFQSNLLSLISHELRTPLTGILNALGMLEEGPEAQAEFSAKELVGMARRNAQRLHQALASILDVAAIESGTFHVRLREVHLDRLVKSRVQAAQAAVRDRGLLIGLEADGAELAGPLLADPQRLGRALDLCLQRVLARAAAASQLTVRVQPPRVEIDFRVDPVGQEGWEQEWSQALAGFQSGLSAPGSAFAGTLQSEQAFLSRMDDGLGNEFLLAHEILRLHGGELSALQNGLEIRLAFVLPVRSAEDGLRAVLGSRAAQLSLEAGGLSSLVLGLVEVPPGQGAEEFRARVKGNLFRASDAAYGLPERRLVAIVLDDCRPEDAPRLLARIEKSVQREAGDPAIQLCYGVASCPADGSDPAALVEIASARLSQSPREKTP